jgi:valyl-tRNA synthetase
MVESWPHPQEQIIDKKTEAKMELFFNIVTAIRNLRAEVEIPLDKKIDVIVATSDKNRYQLLYALSPYIKNLSGIENLALESQPRRPKSSVSALIKNIHIFIPLVGVIDLEKEKIRITHQLEKVELEIEKKQNSLKNKEFLKRAPQEIVEREQARLEELKEISKKLKRIKDELK